MDRRRFLLTSLAGAFAAPGAAGAQPAGKVPKIGWLSDGVRVGLRSYLHDAFIRGLLDLGYVEGQTVTFERRDAAQKMDMLDALAAELVARNVDVIVATSGAAALAAKRRTTVIPIIVAESGDPVAIGLVASLARPGGNVTGMSLTEPQLTAKRLQLLKELAPRISNVAVLFHMPFPATLLALNEARAAAPQLGLAITPMEVVGPRAIEAAFSATIRQRADALLTSGDPFTARYRGPIISLAARHHMPATYALREFADDGGLMAYGPNLAGVYRDTAVFVDKVLKGAKPAELPIQQPTKFEFIVNLKTARALGLTIPPSLLLRADQVLE